jgi:hypothetical protein
MSERKMLSLALMTWSKFYVYILPLIWLSLIPSVVCMVPILASVGWGIRKSRCRFEKICGFIMMTVWLIWGWHAGYWIEYEQRGGWQILVIGAVLYLLVEESDYQHRVSQRNRDEWE